MSGFAAGFFGSVGQALKEQADTHKQQADAVKASQADVFHRTIQSPDATNEERQAAIDGLQKLYPGGPEVKQLFDKFRGLIQSVHGQDGKGDQPQPTPPGQVPPPPTPDQASAGSLPQSPTSTAGVPPPPPSPMASSSASPAAPPTAAPTVTGSIATPAFNPNAGSAVPPPPPPPSKPTFADLAKRAAGPSTDDQETRQLRIYKAQQEILKQNRIEEDEARAKAKALYGNGGNPPRPVFSTPTSVLDARTRSQNDGHVYEGEDGNPIDLSKLPDSMSLQPYTARVTETDDDGNTHQIWKTRYLTVSPHQKSVKVGGVDYEVNPSDASKIPQGAGTAVGPTQIPTTTATTDPATGQTTVAKHTPTIVGATGRGSAGAGSASPTTGSGSSAATPAKSTPIANSPSASPSTTQRSGGGPAPTSAAPSGVATSLPTPKGLPPLDANNRIPDKAGTPQIVEGANQLLNHEKDPKDLPAKTRELSAGLARKYGWDENAFTPQQRRQIGVAASYIDEMLGNPALKTLDKSFISQWPMLGAMSNTDKEGFFGRAFTKLAARRMTEGQAEFMRSYRQLASLISGLGPLSRGSKVTEATVNRLLSDLPNPVNTKNSADAVARLQRLKGEINTALTNNAFEKASGGATSTPKKSTVAAPPPGPSAPLNDQLNYEIQKAKQAAQTAGRP